ncbi:MAG: hypothetical protein VYC38_07455 [Pseudomonadota bacterium]|nr:hypothetical protein [Pseudomonadota bacterium]
MTISNTDLRPPPAGGTSTGGNASTGLAARAVLVFCATVFFTSPAANACVTLKVKNESKVPIRAIWSAGGCAGVDKKSQVPFKCTAHAIPSHSSQSHDFEWGKSAQAVTFYYDGIDQADGMKVIVSYTYQFDSGKYEKTWGLSQFPGTPWGCHRHYTVTYTDKDVKSDSKTARRKSIEDKERTRW